MYIIDLMLVFTVDDEKCWCSKLVFIGFFIYTCFLVDIGDKEC